MCQFRELAVGLGLRFKSSVKLYDNYIIIFENQGAGLLMQPCVFVRQLLEK